MRLTSEEKRAIRVCAAEGARPFSESCYWQVKQAVGVRGNLYDPEVTENQRLRLDHVIMVIDRVRSINVAAHRRANAAKREAHRAVSAAHGYRPEFV